MLFPRFYLQKTSDTVIGGIEFIKNIFLTSVGKDSGIQGGHFQHLYSIVLLFYDLCNYSDK